MRENTFLPILKSILIVVFVLLSTSSFAQQQSSASNNFWGNVQFGGGIGLGIGSGYTDISLSPSAIYNVSEVFALGLGLQGSYVKSKDNYKSSIYGASIIGLINPFEQIQLSAELEETKVRTTFDSSFGLPSIHFWNTALYLGAGYRTDNVTIGVRYDVLHDDTKSAYSEAFMPFVRVYF